MKRLQRLNLPTCREQQKTVEDRDWILAKTTWHLMQLVTLKNALKSLDSYRGPSEEWDFSEVGLGSL